LSHIYFISLSLFQCICVYWPPIMSDRNEGGPRTSVPLLPGPPYDGVR
jgi:hypothetical protein